LCLKLPGSWLIVMLPLDATFTNMNVPRYVLEDVSEESCIMVGITYPVWHTQLLKEETQT
jgi:hypothetical protein